MTDQVAAAFAGGESAFAALTERYRRELHVPSTAARWSGRGKDGVEVQESRLRVQRHDRRDRERHVGGADEYQLRACARAHSSSRTIGRTGVDRLSCRRATIVKPARSNIESVPL